jgi:hypothetical protein
MTWSIAHLEKLKSEGKIRDYFVAVRTTDPEPAGRIVAKHFQKKSKEKDWLAWNLFIWSVEQKVKLLEEYRFDATKKKMFRFDWCFPELQIGIEYEGIFSEKSRHTTVSGYSRDVEKYNMATEQGWRMIRLTAVNYKTVLKTLREMTKSKSDGL